MKEQTRYSMKDLGDMLELFYISTLVCLYNYMYLSKTEIHIDFFFLKKSQKQVLLHINENVILDVTQK